jgi:putative glutamine amidotransferase
MFNRLVSALYRDWQPFNSFRLFRDIEEVTVKSPDELKEGDCLIVWGGEDISPSLYGRKAGEYTHASDKPSYRDVIEWELMKCAKVLGIPIIGVCRGAQMLTALEGGYLIQHVTGHGGTHEVETVDHVCFHTNSIHHQMMVPPKDKTKYEMVAWMPKPLSKVYIDVDDEVSVDVEPEFIYYPNVKGFAIQWHPEGMRTNSPATKYVEAFMENKLCSS